MVVLFCVLDPHSYHARFYSATDNAPRQSSAGRQRFTPSERQKYYCKHLSLIGTTQLIALFCLLFGTIFFSDCAAQPRIPIYLLTMGILLYLTAVCWGVVAFKLFSQCGHATREAILFCLTLVDLICLGTGTIWTISVVNSVSFTAHNSPLFCSRTLYIGSYIFSISSTFLIFVLFCVFMCSVDRTAARQ